MCVCLCFSFCLKLACINVGKLFIMYFMYLEKIKHF